MGDGVRFRGSWRVGVLFSQSGVTAAVERTMLNATMLAIEEVNRAGGILGLPVEAVVGDPASNPQQARLMAQQMLATERLRLIFGCYMSSTRKGVLPVIEAHRGLLFYPTMYEGFEYSARCIYTGAAPNQNAMQLARFLLERQGNRVLMVGSDYVFPHESNRVMADFVRQGLGRVVGEFYVPLDARDEDFDGIIGEIRRTAPDVIFSTVVGRSTALLYGAYRRAGFDPYRQPIASLTTSEAEVAEMTPEAAEGHITAAPFFEHLGTPAATRFVANYKSRFGLGAPVTSSAEAAYFQVHLASLAMRRAGSDEPKRVIAALHDAEFDAPQGRVQVDSDNNHCFLWPRVARLDAQGRFRIVWDPGQRIKPDPYCIVQRLEGFSGSAVAGPAPFPTG
jgi:branched-chain amino acid transport system substrate-binding protein